MPPKPEINEEKVLKAAVKLVRAEGIEGLNARSLAKTLGCSTQPLFRLFANMEALKAALRLELDKIYDHFMEAHVSSENRLLTQGIAYVEFARQEREIFRALFLDHCMDGATLAEIATADWNRRTIENAAKITGLPMDSAERLFLNMWLYSHGMASQLLSNGIDLPTERVEELHRQAFEAFTQLEKKVSE